VETDAADGNPQERIPTAGLKKHSRRTLSFFTVSHKARRTFINQQTGILIVGGT
jgi:hypothetical protein